MFWEVCFRGRDRKWKNCWDDGWDGSDVNGMSGEGSSDVGGDNDEDRGGKRCFDSGGVDNEVRNRGGYQGDCIHCIWECERD